MGERIGNSLQFLALNGSVSAPAYSWANDGDSGWYRIGANNVGLTLNGAKVLDVSTTGLAITGTATANSVLASANDSGALGASGTAFSDLFLASGGVINWNAGNVTLTHSAGLLTLAGSLNISGSNGLAMNGPNSDTRNTLNLTNNWLYGDGGFYAFRSGITHDFNIDVYNSGANTNALKIAQTGVVTIPAGLTISNLTSGRIPLVSTAGLLADSSMFQYDVVNKGIVLNGVGSNTIVGAPNIGWNNGGGTYAVMQLNASNELSIWTNNGSWRTSVTLENAGVLKMSGTLQVTGSVSPSGGAGIELHYGSNIGNIYCYDRTGGAYKVLNLDASGHTFAVSGTTKVYINTYGVGIGQASGGEQLSIGGHASPTMILQSSGANNTRAVVAATNTQVTFGNTYSSSNVPIVFGAAVSSGVPGTEYARFDTSSRFHIGQTVAPGSTCRVGITFTGGGSEYGMSLNSQDWGAGATRAIEFLASGNTAGSVVYTSSTTVSYVGSSDARLKTVLSDQRNWREGIKSLWVGEYNKFTTFEKTGKASREFGVLAQQACEALGGLGIVRPADEGGTWQASAEPFGFLALWGVKDLYAEVDALKAEIATLNSKVN